MAQIGQLEYPYRKWFLYLNPNPTLGPGTWRVSNYPDLDDDGIPNNIENLYCIPPIMNDQVGQAARVYFSIEDCKDILEPDGTVYIPSNITRLLEQGNLPKTSRNGLYDLEEIDAVAPVQSNTVDENAYLWFDISSLEQAEIVSTQRRFRATLGKFKYNSRSVQSLTATQPMEVDWEGGKATVSFDITTLPDA